MFKNVLVGVDGADGGRDAIALARLLRDHDGELTFGYCYPGGTRSWRGTSALYIAAERELAEMVLEDALRESALDATTQAWSAPTAGEGLHELAETIGADLLVVGSSRRGPVGRVFLGDDTRAALNGASCAVAVAPADFRRRLAGIEEVGVGYDGSPESIEALAVARGLASEMNARLSAFTAVWLPATAWGGGASLDPSLVPNLVDRALQDIRVLGDVEAHAAFGNAVEELSAYSAKVGLLVVGSRNYGPVRRLIHGSTSAPLARRAHCPLLVLPRLAKAVQPQPEAEPAVAAGTPRPSENPG